MSEKNTVQQNFEDDHFALFNEFKMLAEKNGMAYALGVWKATEALVEAAFCQGLVAQIKKTEGQEK